MGVEGVRKGRRRAGLHLDVVHGIECGSAVDGGQAVINGGTESANKVNGDNRNLLPALPVALDTRWSVRQ